ncbi:MAG: trypsin-like peptidase domain-containing protein [Chloroflexia bacterium]
MIALSSQDRLGLIKLLQDLPELATERGRREVLELAGLRQLIPRIDLSGASFTAISEVISYLAQYGRVTYEHEALGLFLNIIKSLVGLEQQEYLATLLTKYEMMVPIAPSPGVDTWGGTRTNEEVLEKIVGENTLRPIAFLAQGLHVARSVVYVGLRTGSGTGFLIAPDLLLTNHHVLPGPDLVSETVFRFNYEENWKGEAQPVKEYHAKPGGLFHSNKLLDYSVVQLDQEPGQAWGWLPLRPRAVKRDERVNIVQHPGGQAKQISFQNNFVEYVGGNVVQYVTSTMPGSSGSPVFNDRWEVVALHHAGGNLPEPTTQRRYFRNEGIAIDKILADLPPGTAEMVNAAVPALAQA